MEEKMPYRLSEVYSELMEMGTSQNKGDLNTETRTLIYFFAPQRYCHHDYRQDSFIENVKVGKATCLAGATEQDKIRACRDRYSSTYNISKKRGMGLQDDIYDYVMLDREYGKASKIDDRIRYLCAGLNGTITVRENPESDESKLGIGTEYIEKINHEGLDVFIKIFKEYVAFMEKLNAFRGREEDGDAIFGPRSDAYQLISSAFKTKYTNNTPEGQAELKMIETPDEVARMVFNNIKLRNFEDLDLNKDGIIQICDFACKDTTFIQGMFERLKKKYPEIDNQKLADCLWGICLTGGRQMSIKLHLEDVNKVTFKHIICIPGFLDWISGKAGIPEKITDMKFDYIIMNPPYTIPGDKKLHYRFLQKACEIAETVVSIQPDTWIQNERENPVLDLKGRGVDIDVIGDTEHLFGKKTNLGYKLSITRIDRRIKGIMMKWDGKDRTRPVASFAELDPAKRYGDMLNNITGKIEIPGDRLFNHVYARKRKVVEGGPKSGGTGFLPANNLDDSSVLIDKWIVRLATIIPNRERHPNNFGLMNIDPNKPAIYQSKGTEIPMGICIFETETEARNCYGYLASDAIRSIVMTYKNGSNTIGSMKHVPWPAGDRPFLTGDWSNEAVSDRFGLDVNEREWLKEMLPDCYHVR